ncbi:hypothetical protein ACOSQ2_003025 [Xanthoceras sorbifolium]
MEEFYRKQRSRVQWLKGDDKNTRYFHSQSTARRARNSFDGLFDSVGVWQSDSNKVLDIIINYFQNIFTSKNPNQSHLVSVVDLMEPRITPAMNLILDAAFTRDEIRIALFQMFPTKSSGIDGFPTLFYQKYWDKVRDLVSEAYLDCLNSGKSVRDFNYTLLVLIPKVSNPTRVSEFRPISLCNVIYKIIVTSLFNRFKYMLGNATSENQSVFLPRRMITNNAIIGFECIHSLHKRLRDKGGY